MTDHGLLPCPFCGYAAMTSGDPSDKHDPAINIHCSDCDAEGGWFRGDNCVERATKHWNTRAPLDIRTAAEIEPDRLVRKAATPEPTDDSAISLATTAFPK